MGLLQKENAIENCTKKPHKKKRSGIFESVFTLKKVPDFVHLFLTGYFTIAPSS